MNIHQFRQYSFDDVYEGDNKPTAPNQITIHNIVYHLMDCHAGVADLESNHYDTDESHLIPNDPFYRTVQKKWDEENIVTFFVAPLGDLDFDYEIVENKFYGEFPANTLVFEFNVVVQADEVQFIFDSLNTNTEKVQIKNLTSFKDSKYHK